MKNTVINTICERRSIRAYRDEALTQEELKTLKVAALASPTAMNRQNQRFVFVSDRDTILDIENAVVDAIIEGGDKEFAQRIKDRKGKVIYNAPLFVAIFSKPAKFAGVDAGIAVENLAIAAKGMGLDSVILGMPDAAFVGEKGMERQKQLGIDEEYRFMIGIAIGHPDMGKEPHKWEWSHIIEV